MDLRVRFFIWKIRMSHRIRVFFRLRLKQYFCSHDKTSPGAGWTGTYDTCVRCLKQLNFRSYSRS